jgi:segregation and condensation protein B
MSDAPEDKPESRREQGISLDELAAAYAQSMERRTDSWEEPPGERPEAAEAVRAQPPRETVEEPPPDAADDSGDDPCPLSPTTILEAMLFVGSEQNEPLSSVRAAELMRGVSAGEIPGLVDRLNRRYAASGCPYRIIGEGAGYRIALDRPFYPIRNKFYGRMREARLSQAALDVLAIVAYRQPITAEEVSRLRDTPSGHVLTQLVRRQLLRIQRPPEKRRPISYRTTDRFLELFGLESLDELPESE